MDVNKIDIEDVISKLTLNEKANLLSGGGFWNTYPVHRLGIPALRFSDGPYGVRGTKFGDAVPTASIPSGTVLASSWNVDLMYELGKMMGGQARAKGAHLLLGPTVNMARSPLGGRSFETMGEDPLLTGLLASALSRGIQETKVMICPKHMVCNDKEEKRMSMNVDLSERALREIYMFPFMLLHKYNDPESYMMAYNKIRGKHGAENEYLMKEIVEKEWGFKGCFMSDWFGVVSCADSVNAGLHLEMPGPSIWRGKLVENAVYHNTITEASLDNAVRGVLTLVNPAAESGIPENAPEEGFESAETIALNRQAAREALVLMKNDNVLPFAKKKVLVLGEAAKKPTFCAGGACTVNPYHTVSLYDALVENLGQDNVDYNIGMPNRRILPSLAVYAKEKVDAPIRFRIHDEPRTVADRKVLSEQMVQQVNFGIFEYDTSIIREGHIFHANFSVTINVPVSANYKFNLRNAGNAQLLIDGKVIAENHNFYPTLNDMGLRAPEVFAVHHFEAGKDYFVEIEFESTSGSVGIEVGNVVCGIEQDISPQDYAREASELAKNYEQVIVITGLHKDFETEGFDRDSMDLPPNQDLLVESLLDANPNTVVIIESGTPVTLPWLEKSKALLHSGYLGEELGNALFDVLFGDYNPSGKLTFTWPKKYEDSSSSSSFELDNGQSLTYLDDIYIGYRHFDVKKIVPDFSFGHGLSYTTFEMANPTVETDEKTIDLTVEVKNTGSRQGAAVVQAYVSPKSCSVPTAPKALKGFTKVVVEKGQTVIAKISMDAKLACSFYDTSINKWKMEKGDYSVSVGFSSDALDLSETFTIKKTSTWIMF